MLLLVVPVSLFLECKRQKTSRHRRHINCRHTCVMTGERMDEWMDGWTGVRVDGGKDERTDGRKASSTNTNTNTRTRTKTNTAEQETLTNWLHSFIFYAGNIAAPHGVCVICFSCPSAPTTAVSALRTQCLWAAFNMVRCSWLSFKCRSMTTFALAFN